MIFPKFFSTFRPFFHLIQVWIDLEIWIFRSLENNWYLIGIFRKRAIESWDLWIGMDWFEWAFGKWVSKLNLIWTFENRSFDLWKIILWIFLIFGKSSNHLSNIWRRYNGSLNLYSFEKFGLWMFKKISSVHHDYWWKIVGIFLGNGVRYADQIFIMLVTNPDSEIYIFFNKTSISVRDLKGWQRFHPISLLEAINSATWVQRK